MGDGEIVIQYIMSGVSTGFLYVLMGIGVSFIFSIMRMINWSMGSFYMVGSFCQYYIVINLLGSEYWFLSIFISAAIVFLIGIFVFEFLVKPMFSSTMERPGEYGTIITIGIAWLLQGLMTIINGPFQRTPGTKLADVALPFEFILSGPRFAASAVAACVLLGFYVFIKWSWQGRAFRAAAQNRIGVLTAGINLARLDQLAFGIGVALAALAGALLAPVFLVYPTNGLIASTKAFEVVILGGLGSIPGAVIAGFGLGILESLGAGLISPAYQNVYGFILVIVVLLFRPQGLLGERGREV